MALHPNLSRVFTLSKQGHQESSERVRTGLAWALQSGAVESLDRRWQALHSNPPHNAYRYSAYQHGDFAEAIDEETEILVLGGGLGLIFASALAQRGHAVTLVDRGAVGETHREWNSSRLELQSLINLGLLTPKELEETIAHEYKNGFVEFASTPRKNGTRVWLPGVLDVAISSQTLLSLSRERFLAHSGTLHEHEAFVQLEISERAVRVQTTLRSIKARVVIDAMGVLSPIQFQLHKTPFDWVCPTVGSVVRGLAGVDPSIGEILVTTQAASGGRQLIWELFPISKTACAVYLFHYAPIGSEGSLQALFEDYFRLLPEYHNDQNAEHLKPTFGFIPSRHRRHRTSLPGVVPIADAAAQSSPLTFTGFGSFVRNLERLITLLEFALKHDLLAAQHTKQISARQANLELLPSLAQFMRPLLDDPHSVNRIMNAFNEATERVGLARTKRFYQDRASTVDFIAILSQMMFRYPSVWQHAIAQLGPGGLVQLFGSIGKAATRELQGRIATSTLRHQASTPEQQLARMSHALEWQTMR